MLSYEHYNHQQAFQQSFELETDSIESNTTESYQHTTMDPFFASTNIYNNDLPFSFAPATFLDAPMDNKHEMSRTVSNSSMQRSLHDMPPALLSSASAGSATSSTVGSPYSGHAQVNLMHESYQNAYSPGSPPTIVYDDAFHAQFSASHLQTDMSFSELDNKLTGHFVDPNLLSGQNDPFFQNQYDPSTVYAHHSHSGVSNSAAPSPAPSHNSYHAFSQPLTTENYHQDRSREMSVSSQRSGTSPRTSVSGDEDNNEKGRCTYPDCGRIFKDLKAHMLTHLSERPEKCPIPTCEYSTKGFARKYDKNRHTLTHYRGTMVCSFCPNSGSPGEKLFNRADVFKRHLIQVHNVEQNPPNSRKRSSTNSNKKLSSYCEDATGKCSTCSATFNNAQDFYDHVDDCVLFVVQQEQPSERINEMRLAEVDKDPAVQEALERHHIKKEGSVHSIEEDDFDEDDMEDDDEEDAHFNERSGRGGLFKAARAAGARAVIGGNITKNKSGRKGFMTWSKGGVSLGSKRSKRRKFYPNSWGLPADKMKMKKRVLCVFDGPRQLLKDDMMLSNEFEVRVKLSDGDSYVTDLDIETLKRAEAYHNATDQEKGPWCDEPDFFNTLMG